jgi:hypothetical protein
MTICERYISLRLYRWKFDVLLMMKLSFAGMQLWRKEPLPWVPRDCAYPSNSQETLLQTSSASVQDVQRNHNISPCSDAVTSEYITLYRSAWILRFDKETAKSGHHALQILPLAC